MVCPDLPSLSHVEENRESLRQLLIDWTQAAPPRSLFVVEMDESTSPDVLPEGYEWEIREYRPAQIAIAEISA